MNTTHQDSLNLPYQEVLQFTNPLYYRYEKSEIGIISQLALEAGNWTFTAVHDAEDFYTVTHETGVSFLAELKNGTGKNKGTYQIKGCVQN
ncbi:MAG: hypothetical protein OQK69_10165, partial [Gammaproteobacteria bacterium]|nr:hypothetical protein [Gammaproteobacteria bacterium]